MKIIIAAWHLKNFNVGIGRYSRGLIEAIGTGDQENEYEILMQTDVLPHLSGGTAFALGSSGFRSSSVDCGEQVAPLLAGPGIGLSYRKGALPRFMRGRGRGVAG